MPTKREIIRSLKDAVASKRIIRVYRDEHDTESTWWDAYVIDVSDEWVLLNWVSDAIRLEGHLLFLVRDITVVETNYQARGMIEEALRMDDKRRSGLNGLSIDSTRLILEWAKEHQPVVGLYREHIRRNSMIAGKLQWFREATFGIHRISSAVEWGKEAEYRYDELTRIEFGGGYVRAVKRVATNRGLIPHHDRHL